MIARAQRCVVEDKEPFKVLYEAPKPGRGKEESQLGGRPPKPDKFKYRLPKYDYDKVMSRVKPMMQLHDHPSLELKA